MVSTFFFLSSGMYVWRVHENLPHGQNIRYWVLYIWKLNLLTLVARYILVTKVDLRPKSVKFTRESLESISLSAPLQLWHNTQTYVVNQENQFEPILDVNSKDVKIFPTQIFQSTP
jgi:hypothetical protein